MKRPLSGDWPAVTHAATPVSRRASPGTRPSGSAFTLIEVMVVVGIMGLILAAGIPSLIRVLQKSGMRKVISDVEDVCKAARRQAIMSGAPADLIFHPREGRMEVGAAPASEAGAGEMPGEHAASAVVGKSAQIPEEILIEMLDINLSEYKDSEWARVRFFPNGTSDELTLILRSSNNEWKKITLEVSTGYASVDNVQ